MRKDGKIVGVGGVFGAISSSDSESVSMTRSDTSGGIVSAREESIVEWIVGWCRGSVKSTFPAAD